MDKSQPLVQFPEPSALTLVLLAVAFLAAVLSIVAREVLRRRRSQQRRLTREWESVRAILAERRVEGEDAALLERLIQRHASRSPLHAITTREGFDSAIASEIDRQSESDPRTYEDLGIHLRALRRELGLDYVPIGHAVHSTRELHEGQWMTIARAGVEPPDWTRVMVEDVNEAYFYVMMKDGPSSAAPNLPVGSKVRCMLWRDEDARYAFETTVASHESPPPTWRVRHTASLERTQTRADFRVRHDQAVVAGVLNAPRDKDAADVRLRPVVTRISGRITSLSAGGCALVFKQAVAKHVLLRIALEVPGAKPVDTEVQIVSTAAISGGRFLVRGRFLGLSEDTRDKIARYVLHKQQQRLAAQSAKG